jgi:hypothetical protein
MRGPYPARSFLSLHLRILFQPLRRSGISDPHPLQITPRRLVRMSVALFALVWVNLYMGIYNHLRLDIKHEHSVQYSSDVEWFAYSLLLKRLSTHRNATLLIDQVVVRA